MEIDFEADLRSIVLSVNKNFDTAVGSKLMPCSLVMRLESHGRGTDDDYRSDRNSEYIESLSRIRRYIGACRSDGMACHNSISLDPSMLERAQNDFIEMRQKSSMPGNREINEKDLHRWLVLTRLQARSRIGIGSVKRVGETCFAAEVEDWDNAMILDEAMITVRQ
jgi:hypothetical protein